MKNIFLYANGCSFTWGGELYKSLFDKNDNLLDCYNPSPINKERLQVTWPGILSKKLGGSFINDAMGCGSNERILRTTTNFFLKNKPDNPLAIIQFTSPIRGEYYDEDLEKWYPWKDKYLVLPNKLKNKHDKLYKCLEEYMVLIKYSKQYYVFYQQMLALHNFFESNNIPYIFMTIGIFDNIITGVKKICEKEKLPMDIFNFIKKPNGNIRLDNEYVFASHHPNRKGHTKIADILYNEIQL
tara:strand:- start:839 stop:1561 length:723 start_codon:yes stop_codon:yes gene_type:complete